MAKMWMRLDLDWRDDPKVMDYEDRHGKAALVDLIGLFCLLAEFDGTIDLKDNGNRLAAQKRLGKKGKALDRFLDGVAECGLISADAWHGALRVGSDRSVREGEVRRRRRESARAASEKAAERHAEKQEARASCAP